MGGAQGHAREAGRTCQDAARLCRRERQAGGPPALRGDRHALARTRRGRGDSLSRHFRLWGAAALASERFYASLARRADDDRRGGLGGEDPGRLAGVGADGQRRADRIVERRDHQIRSSPRRDRLLRRGKLMRRKRPTVAEQIRLGAYFFTTGAIDLAIAQFTAATRRAPHSASEKAKPTIHILPGGDGRSSILQRLLDWRRTHFAAWRIKLARLGWKRLYFYSVGLAFGFLRAFWRLSPRLGLKESVHWTSGGVRLARTDADLAKEYFDSVSDLMLRLPPEARGRLLALTADLPHLYSAETARERLRLALAIVEAAPDYELVARILDVAISITRSSLGYSRDFLRQAAEIIRQYDATNPLQRALFLRALDHTGRFTTHLVVKFFNAAAPIISNARSEGDEARASQLCARLFEHTSALMDFGHGGALNFFLSGIEFLRIGDEAVIDKWTELCGGVGRAELREFAIFTERAVEPTRAMVSLALARGDMQSRELALSALDHAIAVSGRNMTAAINCYLASPELLRRMSPDGYEAWVKRGLASFTEPEKLAAYFSIETRASQTAIEETAGALRLDDVSRVLMSYVRMLTGKAVPITPRPMKYDALEPDTGESIGLPELINGLRDNEERFHLYKALAAQAAGQIEFGTYETGTEELRALGLELQRHFPRLTPAQLNGNTDWLTLVTLFPLTTLARRLFTILENARVERQLRLRYRGLGRELDMARGQRRRSRPPDQYLVKYEGLLDLLFKEALGAGVSDDEPDLDDEQRAWLKKAREALAARIYKDGANVADTVRACLDLYDYLSPAPPENSLPWQDPHTRPEREEKGEKQQPRRERPRREVAGQPAAGQPEEKPEEQPAIATGAPEVEPAFLSFASTAAEGGALDDLRDPNVFFYDEWDCRIGDYRARWCRVTERDWEQGDPSFARKTLSAYRGALSQVRYQFQLMRPAGLRRVRGLVDGDNFDLEAVIDHIVDRRPRARCGGLLSDRPVEFDLQSRQRRQTFARCREGSVAADERGAGSGGRRLRDLRFFEPRAALRLVLPVQGFRRALRRADRAAHRRGALADQHAAGGGDPARDVALEPAAFGHAAIDHIERRASGR